MDCKSGVWLPDAKGVVEAITLRRRRKKEERDTQAENQRHKRDEHERRKWENNYTHIRTH
jgi:Zn-finger nucleic acid-binding protein